MWRSRSLPFTRWQQALKALVIAGVMAIAIIVGPDWQRLTAHSPAAIAATADSQSELRAVDIDAINEMPFWIWVVLPRLFPEKLPGAGGYTSLGITWERGSELPIGFTKETRGLDRVILTDPANANFDVERYAQFLVDCAQDPRFNPDFILPEITYNINLSLGEKLIYRLFAIPKTKRALLS